MVKRNLGKDMAAEGSSSKRARVAKSYPRAGFAKATRQVVLRMAEKKMASTTISEIPVNSVSLGNNFVALSNIAEGAGNGQRTGREIHLDSLSVRSVLHNNSTGTHLVRVVIGYVQDQGTPGPTTEFFEGIGRTDPPFSFSANGVIYMTGRINPVKFKTIYDKVHKLGSSSDEGANVKMLNVYKKLRGTKIRFEQAATGAANQDKQLYIGAWTAEGGDDAGAGTAVEWHFVAQLKYTDL